MALPDPIDPSQNAYLSGVYQPIESQLVVEDLPVAQGAIPPDLSGCYFRNGPNPRFTPLGAYVYPLEGDGMIHAVSMADGKATYRNAFVRTPMIELEEQAGHALWPSLMKGALPDPAVVGERYAFSPRDMPAINVACHHGRLIALAETTSSYRITPFLETLDAEDFGGAFPQGAAAHPKVDPVTGELVTFTYNAEAPFLQWVVLNPDGSIKTGPHTVDVDKCYMVHDVAITETKIVLGLNPAIFDLTELLAGGSPLQWRPELGSRIALIPRDGVGPTQWFDGEAFWVWHYANAYDTPEGVEVQPVTWTHIGNDLGGVGPSHSALEVISLTDGSSAIARTSIRQQSMEFPRIDDRQIGLRHRQVAVGARGTEPVPPGSHDTVLVIDTETGAESSWRADGLLLGEPCFIPAEDGSAGYYATFATAPKDMSSYFVILPADNVAAGPVATITMPQRVPMGLHGAWVGADDLARVSTAR